MDDANARERTILYRGPDGGEFEGLLIAPDGPSRAGVLFAHDWSGLNAGSRAMARRVASLGFTCFALDLYGRGVRGDELGDNSELMGPLLRDRGLLRRRLLTGVEVASSLPELRARQLAVMGPCFGGLCALDLARATSPKVVATISIHGGLQPPGLGPQPPITARILVLHGWADPFATAADVLALARELTAAGADWQLHAYGHAMHAFTFERAATPASGVAYHAPSARRAWSSIEAFLRESLDAPGYSGICPTQ